MVDIIQSASVSRSFFQNLRIKDAIKRAVDIAVSLAVLIFCAPFYGLIAWSIKRDSHGPVLYRGLRMGRGGKPFHILKFRTMTETPQSYNGPKVTAHDDPRVTQVGRWLRDTKINEFPQFWNVLKGEMSLVGPRPEDPEIAKGWPKPVFDKILSVRPGITSPASIYYRNEERLLSVWDVEQKYFHELSPDKQRLDQMYVHHRSFTLDIDVVLWTMVVLLPKLGTYKPPEELVFVGFLTRFIYRFLNWFTIDLSTSLLAFGFNLFVYRAIAPLNVGALHALGLIFGFALLFSVAGVLLGTNRVRWSRASPADFLTLLPSWVLATVIVFLVNLWRGFFPSTFVFTSSGLSLVGFLVVRYRHLIYQGIYNLLYHYEGVTRVIRDRVLIIGLGASAQHTAWLLGHFMNSKLFSIVGFVDNDLTKQGMRFYGANVIGKWQDIPGLVNKHDIGTVILADYRVDAKDFLIIKDLCSSASTRLVVMPDLLISINRLANLDSSAAPEGCEDKVEKAACLNCLAKHSSIARRHYWKYWHSRNRESNLSTIRKQAANKRFINYKLREAS